MGRRFCFWGQSLMGMRMRAKFKFFLVSAVFLFLAACTSRSTFPVTCGCAAASIPLGSEADLVANVGDRAFFNFNSSTLTAYADQTLTRQSAWLTKYPALNVLIAGNADERGTETYNLALGQRRANAARDYLVAQGVSEARIQMISYGKDCPVATDHNEAAYQQNRNAITSVAGMNPQNCH
jgi:peptidoglycan-associated lipoprotein